MYSARLMHLLTVALSITKVAQASWFDGVGDIVMRQDLSSTEGPTASPTTEVPPTTTDPTTTEPTTTNESTTQPTTTEPTTTEESSTTTPTTTEQSSTRQTTTSPTTTLPTTTRTSVSETSETSSNPETTANSSTSPTTTHEPVTSTKVVTSTSIMPNGDPTTIESTELTTSTPGLSTGETTTGNEGIDANTKKTIIGVCVGVGGAIILGVAGLLYWRLSNKRRTEVDREELQSFGTGYAATSPGTAEKSEASGSTRSPFQSTLESYHAPTQTNTASNF